VTDLLGSYHSTHTFNSMGGLEKYYTDLRQRAKHRKQVFKNIAKTAKVTKKF